VQVLKLRRCKVELRSNRSWSWKAPLENGHIMGIQARIREKIMGPFGKLEDFPAFDG